MKYAVVEHAGKQFIAREGETIELDRLSLEEGKAIEFKEILLISAEGAVDVGMPYIKGAKVRGRVELHGRGPKLRVFKFKPKQRYRRHAGHRQAYSRVSIETIGLAKAAPVEAPSKAIVEPGGPGEEKQRTRAPRARKPAAKKPEKPSPGKPGPGSGRGKPAAERAAPKPKPAARKSGSGGKGKAAPKSKSAEGKKPASKAKPDRAPSKKK